MMNVCILFGSPRQQGNTAQLLAPVKEYLKKQGHDINEISLYWEEIRPCIACRHSRLEYVGMLAERQRSYKEAFMDEEKRQRAILFARKIERVCSEGNV